MVQSSLGHIGSFSLPIELNTIQERPGHYPLTLNMISPWTLLRRTYSHF